MILLLIPKLKVLQDCRSLVPGFESGPRSGETDQREKVYHCTIVDL